MTVVACDDASSAVRAWWSDVACRSTPAQAARPLVAAALLRSLLTDAGLVTPLPGQGNTWLRFETLAALGEVDLTVARLAEAHYDAVAIVAELAPHTVETPAGSVWAVWAAEPPTARVSALRTSSARWRLDGRKAWCSGAGGSTHALVTAHSPDGARLFAVDLSQPGVAPVDDAWPTPALAGTDTRSVDFDGALATAVGGPGDYVNRPGFWHGSVGVAAVWFGGTVAIARTLMRAGQRRGFDDIDRVHLGAVGRSLAASRAALRIAADGIDGDPTDSACRALITARSTRAVVEAAAADTIDRVGRALGAAPLALDGDHARRVADLGLYLRQSHGDRDLADLGQQLLSVGELW